MGHVDYGLLGVSFLLGLVLTFALTIRRVTREVPVGSSASIAGAAAAAAPVKGSPYGAGSARPDADGGGPEGWLVKGNEDSMLYHTPDSPHYDETIAEVWFKDEESAEKGGFTPWHKGKK
jgi:uncharacterized membrane protein ArfC